jgi:hypothetical protein
MSEYNIEKSGINWKFKLPHLCPLCNHLVVIDHPTIYFLKKQSSELIYQCPNPDCGRFFIGYYSLTYGSPGFGWTNLERFIPVEPTDEELPQFLDEISENFRPIYSEALEAKQLGLNQICGPGFRKAFEFLIKDYAKSKTDSEREKKEIEDAFAGKVVNDYIEDKRIQQVAKRALWLGNDETHYLRKWEQKNIEDLINLIKLSIHWIQIEKTSSDYVSEMPEK